MADLYERIDDYNAVTISLASPEEIRSWSYGEVKKPETINYRTYRSEKDGLFCERIFGPERDWECFCGKYKGMKHKGIICDRCGVKVTHSRERRKRMGHINLAAPVAHIWFFKAMPSRLGNLLNMKVSNLEKVIYFQEYVVINPGEAEAAGIKAQDLLTEDEYRELREKHGDSLEAEMGAGAIKKLLATLDLDAVSAQLRQDLRETGSEQKHKDYIKRLKIVEAIRGSSNQAQWMVLDVIPVIPPDLRPLELLESGNFATSDLNDLYRRVINRNSRLKKLMELHAPEVIIRNEKRMLQQSVDALFDNERCKRSVLGSSSRPLKSLTDMIKGKQGRFRENLLGKRVDYSARSVIVVGPSLKLHQCGLPKKIALELFQPFIIRRLKELGYVDTIKSAKKMLERKDEEVWDILDEVIHQHPVLLNRAPTLHRMGIQAFEPVLVEGNAIHIHPLVCEAFNADFDGDQMAVHLPLSIEAQSEATVLMLSTNNIFSPADGSPIIGPSLDMVMGCYYLTIMYPLKTDEAMPVYDSTAEAIMAYDQKKISLHDPIKIKLRPGTVVIDEKESREIEAETGESSRLLTTVGRMFFNDALPDNALAEVDGARLPYYNLPLDKAQLSKIIIECHDLVGRTKTIELLDAIKSLGFKWATLSGLSIATSDLRTPKRKQEILRKTQTEVDKIERNYRRGVITQAERYHQIIEQWTHASNAVAEDLMDELKNDSRDGEPYLNPLWLMFASKARGSSAQIRQLAGMRGLMTKPSGRIMETPIKANFREGLPVLEYFSSTHGGRKGLADTALKTAESGYLTRKLADVAQNVVISEDDCRTVNGITKSEVRKGETIEVPLSQIIRGRVSQEAVVNKLTDEVIVKEGDMIHSEQAQEIEDMGYTSLKVRSPMTCESPRGVCAKCYGMDLSTGEKVEEGLAVGIIGAQSIGEPGTQLTMRTFHIGGTAQRTVEEAEIRAPARGVVTYENVRTVITSEAVAVVLNQNGEAVLTEKDGTQRRYQLRAGAKIHVKENGKVKPKDLIADWDPHVTPIICEKTGTVQFEDIVEEETMREEVDTAGSIRKVIVEHKGDLHPQILIVGKDQEPLAIYSIPEKAILDVDEGQEVAAGTQLARTPREIGRTEDITAGLPRVTELFEARKPKDPAIISEISGVVELGERKRGKRTIIVRNETGIEREHLVPHGKHLTSGRGDRVREGDRLVDGPLIPQDILRISGEEAVQQYLVREIQSVYRTQHETIDDKHIEVIVAQMMRKVHVTEDTGDTSFLPGTVVDKFAFRAENERVVSQGGKPASATPLLFGITKAALQSESFISAASFQETTKVLTEAALAGKTDYLLGLKENVILGHMIPAGTGFYKFRRAEVQKKVSLPELPEEGAEEGEPALIG